MKFQIVLVGIFEASLHVPTKTDTLRKSKYTVPFSHSQSICILCYDLRVLWPAESTIKSHATPLEFWLLIDINWNFKCLKSQSSSLNCCKTVDSESWRSKKNPRPFGFEATFLRVYIVNCCSSGGPGSIPGHCKL